MNKKEINEIKKNFSDDCPFFTINNVLQAFVDSEKNIKFSSCGLYNAMPQEESELIAAILKKTLSGSVGKNLLEYHFPKEAYSEGGSQEFFYRLLSSRLGDEELNKAFLSRIAEKMEYVSTYALFAAHCTYSVLNRGRNGERQEDAEAEIDYNFIITAVCPVNLRIDGLIYSDEQNGIIKKPSSDRIVEMPSDGFLFPVFSDRMPDVNGALYYSKNANKPNVSVVNDLLGCEFGMSCKSEKETFRGILSSVVGEELDYDLITSVNDKIAELVDISSHETEIPTVSDKKLASILWESGVSEDKLQHLPKVYESAMGGRELTAVNLVERKTVLSASGITVNIGRDSVDKVRTQTIEGKRCLIIDLDDPEISVNGMPANVD